MQGKKPMFMLRKIATSPGIETDITSLRSTQPISEGASVPTQTSSLMVKKRVLEDDGDDNFGVDVSKRREDLIIVGRSTAAPFSSSSIAAADNTATPSLTLLEPSSKPPSPSADIVFKSLRVSVDDPCWQVLPEALQKYNLRAEWRSYAMWIVYGDVERCVKSKEKPLAMFRDLEREGKKPTFMLRKWPTENIRARQELLDSRQGSSGQSPTEDQQPYTISAPSPTPGFVRSFSRPRAGSPTQGSPAPTVPSTLADDVRSMAALAKELAYGKVVEFPFRAKALHDFYQGYGYTQTTYRLKFRKDEMLDICDISGRWWTARKSTGEVGLVPPNYLVLL